jgi:hypothetical protein
MDILTHIKQLVIRRQVIVTIKAELEMMADNLTKDEVYESIINATRIEKTIRSTSRHRENRREILYVIKGPTYANIEVYTKGKLIKDRHLEMFYVLISSKRALYGTSVP